MWEEDGVRPIGLILCHVDDLAICGLLETARVSKACEDLRKRFDFGGWNEETGFLGVHIKQELNGDIVFNQAHYVEKLKMISIPEKALDDRLATQRQLGEARPRTPVST